MKYVLPYGVEIEVDQGAAKMLTSGLEETFFGPCNDEQYLRGNGIIEGFERFLLAMACEGIDLADPRVSRALQSAVEGAANELE